MRQVSLHVEMFSSLCCAAIMLRLRGLGQLFEGVGPSWELFFRAH